MRFKQAGHTRPGASEVLGTVIMMALTIVAAVAVFSYIKGQAAVSEGQYGQSVGQGVSNLEESFEVATLNFNYPNGCSAPCKSSQLTMYLYNKGNIANQFQQVEIYNSTRSKLDFTFTGSYVTDLNDPSGCHVAATTSYESTLLGTGTGSLTVSIGQLNSDTLSLPQQSACYPPGKSSPYQFVQGDTYFVKLLGIYGNTVTYYQVM